jgi:hypothetical protein
MTTRASGCVAVILAGESPYTWHPALGGTISLHRSPPASSRHSRRIRC